jgi:hypothetical protein
MEKILNVLLLLTFGHDTSLLQKKEKEKERNTSTGVFESMSYFLAHPFLA